mmetsp:Transcript_22184/g.33540  ORF Transcript_22184/g.33540 Transcript_22184/m.33540 type:complete len:98 (+) Transcript_22184:176-469(+)
MTYLSEKGNLHNLSWRGKENFSLLQRLINWRVNRFEVQEMKEQLTKRGVAFAKKTLKPELSELLREAIESEMQHLTVHLMAIRDMTIEFNFRLKHVA